MRGGPWGRLDEEERAAVLADAGAHGSMGAHLPKNGGLPFDGRSSTSEERAVAGRPP